MARDFLFGAVLLASAVLALIVVGAAAPPAPPVQPLAGFRDHGDGRVSYCLDGHRILEVQKSGIHGGVALLLPVRTRGTRGPLAGHADRR